MKLKQLKSLIDEQAPSVLSEFSSRKDAIAYLKLKVNAILAKLMSNPPTESYAYLHSDKSLNLRLKKCKLNHFYSEFLIFTTESFKVCHSY